MLRGRKDRQRRFSGERAPAEDCFGFVLAISVGKERRLDLFTFRSVYFFPLLAPR
jgi:hypothetical protein